MLQGLFGYMKYFYPYDWFIPDAISYQVMDRCVNNNRIIKKKVGNCYFRYDMKVLLLLNILCAKAIIIILPILFMGFKPYMIIVKIW